jgi:hypothetical protein
MPSARILNANGQMFVDTNDGTGGRAQIADNDPLRAGYGAFVAGFTPAATPTDFMQITGSATKIVRIRLITITGTATAASNVIIYFARRSTLSTGTTTNLTAVPRDRTDDAATAVVQTFSANPTLGTSIGNVDGCRLNIAPAANGSIDRAVMQYSWYNDKAIVLRGANDALCLNLNGAAWPAGGALDINVVWSEETFTQI